MTSKAAKRRKKKRRVQGQQQQQAPNTRKTVTSRSQGSTARPTPERLAKGTWAEPQGMGKDMQPIVDLASDMIGVLFESRKITGTQEQAARTFQQIYAAYLEELGVIGFKSCLAGSIKGHDESDGDPEKIAAYRSLEKRIGRLKMACLRIECDKLPNQHPQSLTALRQALDAVAA